MLIGIISDSHDSINNLQKLVSILKEKKIKMLIHAGDFCSPFTAFVFNQMDIRLIGVFGNNDGDKLLLKEKYNNFGEIFDYAKLIILDKKRILITHYPCLIESLAKSGNYEIIIYGHTHKVDIRQINKTLIINPGALCAEISAQSTFVILNTDTSQTDVIEV